MYSQDRPSLRNPRLTERCQGPSRHAGATGLPQGTTDGTKCPAHDCRSSMMSTQYLGWTLCVGRWMGVSRESGLKTQSNSWAPIRGTENR